MLGVEETRRRSGRRIVVASVFICAIFAGMAGWAFRLSSEMVGPAAAQGGRAEPKSKVAMLPPVAPTAALVRPNLEDVVATANVGALSDIPGVNPGGSHSPVQPAHTGRTPAPPVQPMLMSRAQPMQQSLPTSSAPSAIDDPVSDSSADVDEWASYEPWTPGRDDTYRTVCVRLCDGAYFPISFSTTRSRFKADAARCQAGCSSPARLFVVKPEGAAEEMVDVRGSAYADLPNAFRFRTSYDAACTCKGQPWDVAARDRHLQYAAVTPAIIEPQAAKPAAKPVVQPAPAKLATIHSVRSQQQVAALGPDRLSPAATDMPAGAAQASGGALSETKARIAGAVPEAGKPVPPAAKAASGKKARANGVKVAHSTVVVRSAQRTVVAQLDAAHSGQRSFRSSDYWRLSVWDHN